MKLCILFFPLLLSFAKEFCQIDSAKVKMDTTTVCNVLIDTVEISGNMRCKIWLKECF